MMPVHNYQDDDNKVVTIAERKSLRPALPQRDNETTDVPSLVYFVMPDGIYKPVLTSQDISIGRKPREEDPAVTVDFEVYEGHSLGVSRQHALIKLVKGSLTLVDLDSINGTYINGHRISPIRRYSLQDGDKLSFGKITIQLMFYRSR